MNDKELLELAALAAGITAHSKRTGIVKWYSHGEEWNPLKNNSDAFSLAVKLGISYKAFISSDYPASVALNFYDGGCISCDVKHDGNQDAATRRAIVKVAAEIGNRIKEGGE